MQLWLTTSVYSCILTAVRMSFLLALFLTAGAGLASDTSRADFARAQFETKVKSLAAHDGRSGKRPESTQGLELLFGEESRRLGVPLVTVRSIYDSEYELRASRRPILQRLRPQNGWTVAIVLFILLIFRDFVKRNITRMFTKVSSWMYRRASRYSLARPLALNRYRTALEKRCSSVKLPFRPDRPLDVREIYIPIRVSSSSKTIDAFEAFAGSSHILLLGQPGAGIAACEAVGAAPSRQQRIAACRYRTQ